MGSLTDRERLTRALAALAVARGAEADEFALQVYLEALSDVDVRLLERACFDLAREPRAEFESALPPVATIRSQASAILRVDSKVQAEAQLLPMPKSQDDEPRYFCPDCLDEPNGWRVHQCSGWKAPVVDERTTARLEGLDGRHCGRRIQHIAHSFCERCHCWQRNPVVWQRKQQLTGAATPT